MNCQLCSREFDEGRRRPKLLPKCGHSVCADCLARLRAAGDDFRCPTDGIAYAKKTEIFDNAFVLESLTAARVSFSHCARHGKDLELFCRDCGLEICANCALFGDHKAHGYEELTAYKGRVADRLRLSRKRVEELEQGLTTRAQEGIAGVARIKTERQAQIDARFEELNAAVERARSSAYEHVSLVCDGLVTGFEQLHARLREFAAKLDDCGKDALTLREETVVREVRELERACEQNELCRGREALLARTELVYARTALDAVARFVTLRRAGEPSTPKSLAKLGSDLINEEDNLLQESFKELLRQDSLLSSDEKPSHKHERTPTHVIRLPKSHSPVSGFGGNVTARSGLAPPSAPFFDARRLSLSPLSASIAARPAQPVSPARPALSRSGLFEPADCATSLKPMQGKAAAERVPAQLELVLCGKSNVLDLSAASLDDRALEGVARRLPELKGCRTIKLSNNQLTDQGLKLLLKSIKDLSVEYIFLGGNQLRDAALDYLISFRKYNACLKCVYLNGNPIAKGSGRTRLKLKLLEEGSVGLVL